VPRILLGEDMDQDVWSLGGGDSSHHDEDLVIDDRLSGGRSLERGVGDNRASSGDEAVSDPSKFVTIDLMVAGMSLTERKDALNALEEMSTHLRFFVKKFTGGALVNTPPNHTASGFVISVEVLEQASFRQMPIPQTRNLDPDQSEAALRKFLEQAYKKQCVTRSRAMIKRLLNLEKLTFYSSGLPVISPEVVTYCDKIRADNPAYQQFLESRRSAEQRALINHSRQRLRPGSYSEEFIEVTRGALVLDAHGNLIAPPIEDPTSSQALRGPQRSLLTEGAPVNVDGQADYQIHSIDLVAGVLSFGRRLRVTLYPTPIQKAVKEWNEKHNRFAFMASAWLSNTRNLDESRLYWRRVGEAIVELGGAIISSSDRIGVEEGE